MSATFALIILEEYLWRKGSLKISYREHSYIFLCIYFFESVTVQGTLWNGVSYDYKYSGDNHCVKNHEMRSFLVRIFLYSYWIQENTDQKKLHIWTLFTHWNLAPIVLFFCYMQTLCYFMSLAPLKIDVFPVHKLRTRFAWKIFFQFWKTKKGGFFNSITAPILSKTGSLNLRKSCPLINSYLLHMMIFVERRTLHE